VLVFARQGLAATKIADIAAAGEISQGLIYRYFTSKEEIYAAVLERAMQSTLRIGREALESEGVAAGEAALALAVRDRRLVESL
jgi:AcrR family transcriptional regulator